ncbi:RNA polymerase sigma factor [Sulfitobacter sp. F26204]|uniref:RNA polymerase sigma factor n=1 Tax=Sulfitobacter sp. F26204 TaxID=2996014 RepID=UPI00225E66A7|nr:RNA polymerase sigma factor [Sulfitobacter sp. F26204]MCX7559518.1 RNA polymerase sigma factor [Sulfitobacter sp. F26204]
MQVTELLPKLQRRARRLALNRAEAEDMAQETVLRLWQRLNSQQVIDAPERYAMTMLHNLARQRWRKGHRTEQLTEDMAQIAPVAPARIACAQLIEAIGDLPRDQAVVMNLVVTGETSPDRMAKRLGVPRGTVMSRLGRARAKLRAAMDLEGSVADLL